MIKIFRKWFWVVRLNLWAILILRTLNTNMWNMGSSIWDATEENNYGYSPKEALLDELTYWD